ncbi:hypothetical protein AB1Y20_014763 [Prymnesium parvum]|uniref:C3H1-type domain-containing protein n=1 Tax=Prymnesium parvum TaxID=97485 RepID=A0AB34IFC9_PRYPA|mmetsp:Transcript_25028/g.60464  ORF Transcript_25028/g.60464 Transcript_25028/m.60464 type:complete len:306 (-) Transcript_25028:479-1396(-)
MSSSFCAGIVCQACSSPVAPLDRLACVQDNFGCHLICALESLRDQVNKQRPHPEMSDKPFKVGKLICGCGGNLGNIQDNIRAFVPEVGLNGRGECAVFKFADVSFAIAPNELIPQLKGVLLGKAVGFLLPGKGGKGGGRGRGPGLGRGRATCSPPCAHRITVEHVQKAAACTDDLERLQQAEQRRLKAPETRAPLVPAPDSADPLAGDQKPTVSDNLVLEPPPLAQTPAIGCQTTSLGNASPEGTIRAASNFKTKMCWDVPGCRRGAKCSFAHSQAELRRPCVAQQLSTSGSNSAGIVENVAAGR